MAEVRVTTPKVQFLDNTFYKWHLFDVRISAVAYNPTSHLLIPPAVKCLVISKSVTFLWIEVSHPDDTSLLLKTFSQPLQQVINPLMV